MGFYADAGRIYITDSDDHIVFDTDERLFVATDYAEGQITTPQRQAASQNGSRTIINVDSDTVITSINAAADTIFGAFKVTVTGIDALASAGWFQATGSYMNARFIINATGNPTPHTFIGGHIIYTFRADGGQLIFNERSFIKTTLSLGATLITSTMPTCDIDYKLFCGSFV